MEHLRPDQMAELLLVTIRTIYRAIEKGTFERVLVRGRTRVKIPEEIKEMKPDDYLLRPSDVAKTLNVSRSTIYRWFWEGRLAGTLLFGRTLRLFKSGIDAFISEGERIAEEKKWGFTKDDKV